MEMNLFFSVGESHSDISSYKMQLKFVGAGHARDQVIRGHGPLIQKGSPNE